MRPLLAAKFAVMATAVMWNGQRVRTLERVKPARPFETLPDWLVGMLVLMFRDSRQPAPRQTATAAWREWQIRRAPIDVGNSELWRISIATWHDTDLSKLLLLPAGSHFTHSEYTGMGDVQRYLVRIPKGSSIRVLDPDRVRIERVF